MAIRGYDFDGKSPVVMNPTEAYEWHMQKHDAIVRLTNYVTGTPYFAAIACNSELGIILANIFYTTEDMEGNYAEAVEWQQIHSKQFEVTILGGDING